MTQIEAWLLVMAMGFIASSIISFLPDKFSPFRVWSAKMYFGVGVWMLILNLWPVFSSEKIVNRDGEEIYSFFVFVTLLAFVFFILMAVRENGRGE